MGHQESSTALAPMTLLIAKNGSKLPEATALFLLSNLRMVSLKIYPSSSAHPNPSAPPCPSSLPATTTKARLCVPSTSKSPGTTILPSPIPNLRPLRLIHPRAPPLQTAFLLRRHLHPLFACPPHLPFLPQNQQLHTPLNPPTSHC